MTIFDPLDIIKNKIIKIQNLIKTWGKVEITIICNCGNCGSINLENLTDKIVCSSCGRQNDINKILITIIDNNNNLIFQDIDYKIFNYLLILKLIKKVSIYDFSGGDFKKSNPPYIGLEFLSDRLAYAFYLLLIQKSNKNSNRLFIKYIKPNRVYIRDRKSKTIQDYNIRNERFFKTIVQYIIRLTQSIN